MPLFKNHFSGYNLKELSAINKVFKGAFCLWGWKRLDKILSSFPAGQIWRKSYHLFVLCPLFRNIKAFTEDRSCFFPGCSNNPQKKTLFFYCLLVSSWILKKPAWSHEIIIVWWSRMTWVLGKEDWSSHAVLKVTANISVILQKAPFSVAGFPL